MIQAEMKGKIPEIDRLEDVLTSNVFGLLRYVKNPAVLLWILGQARTLSGKGLAESVDVDLTTYSPEFLFWEQVGTYGEPDLIIRFSKAGNSDLILCIEVKYYSSKSGEGDDDQLRRYFEGVSGVASLSASTLLGIIYLTKHPSRKELIDSLKHIQGKGVINAEEKLFQLRWTEMAEALENADLSQLSTSERMVLTDLRDYLRYKNLVGFSGFSFRSKAFVLGPEKFYEFNRFSGFSFFKEDFEVDAQVILYGR
jgi:hypothetical protein